MEDDPKGGGALPSTSRVPTAATSTPPPPAAATQAAPSNPKESIASGKRQMFSMELKPGQTTIVSWKKLLKEGTKNVGGISKDSIQGGSGSVPAAAATVQPMEGEQQDAQPSNRFSAVIEKIERLYMGKHSSDEEELDDTPDDDQYDTEDSFIDDAELDEYFQVDKLSTKHNGYFVNRGKLEGIESSSSPNLASKKRRRKDSSNAGIERSKTNREHIKKDPNIRMKVAARKVPSAGMQSQNPAEMQIAYGEHHHQQEGKTFKNKQNASTGTYKKRSLEIPTAMENTPYGRISKDLDSHKADPTHKLSLTNDLVDPLHHVSRDRAVISQVESHSKKLLNYENEAKARQKERHGTIGSAKMDSATGAYSLQAVQASATRRKDGSAIKPKSTALERAIRDLEKIVALCRPPKVDIQEVDASSQVVKRRLPQDVKQKLAKVARLSVNQNKISEDALIERLMGIVGHIIQRRSLKRNMREMVESGLSAKQEKIDRFQEIRKEVDEMIKIRVTLLKSKAEQQDGSADDFQVNGNDERTVLRKYAMDNALEDKICELYDLYAERMDDDKGLQSKKLYVELAELWPNGYVDSNAIKDAICRSKDRKRSRLYRHKVRDEERINRKKLASAARVEETNIDANKQSIQERPPTYAAEKIPTNQPMVSPSDLVNHHVTKHHEKPRVSSSNATSALEEAKKKLKRKPESDLTELHAHPTKISNHGKEIQPTPQNKIEDLNVSIQQPKPNVQLSGPSVFSDQRN